MSSEEIREKLFKLNTERENLEKELLEALDTEEKERKKKLFNDTKAAIFKLWDLFWKKEENTEELYEKINGVNRNDCGQNYLNSWLESDIKFVLKKTKMKGLEKVKEVIKDLPNIDLNSCIEDAKIRGDFASALRNVKKGSDLSHKVRWAFDTEDLMNLMELHRSNKFRKKIEDLLEDCNFHEESGLLSERRYEEYTQLEIANDLRFRA